jgi:hypothetical protein
MMTTKATEDTNKLDQEAEQDPLMAVYNPQPPQAEQPARFYWQEPWHEAEDAAVQAAFES